MAYYVYLMTNQRNGTLYLGVTNDLVRRVHEHKAGALKSFTKRYDVKTLAWFEVHDSVEAAILREKELKKWRRGWKVQLIEAQNPFWSDLYPSIAVGGG